MSARRRRGPRFAAIALLAGSALLAACADPAPTDQLRSQVLATESSSGAEAATPSAAGRGEPDPRAEAATVANDASTDPTNVTRSGSSSGPPPTSSGEEASAAALAGSDHRFTVAFAGDVNFAERTADRLAADPATAFGVAAPGLAAADLTVVNLETAITTGGAPEPKSFTFRAPPTALTALKAAGVDVASMANNHGADYGATGLADTVAAIAQSGFPVIGIGANDAQATAPYRTTINGVDVTIFAASQVRDHTLESWTATATSPGIASAFDPRLINNVRTAAAAASTVIVFLHWGTEYDSCPDSNQVQLAAELAAAGARAVIGAHAHVLQGAGWRSDGVYVGYGLSNYLWWRSFGNEQDDNGVLTLTFDGNRVVASDFAPSQLDDTGVPVPATGAQQARIRAEWDQVRGCADLSGEPPG